MRLMVSGVLPVLALIGAGCGGGKEEAAKKGGRGGGRTTGVGGGSASGAEDGAGFLRVHGPN